MQIPPQDFPVPIMPSACTGLYDKYILLRDESLALSEQLETAVPGAKPGIASQIKAKIPELDAARAAWLKCCDQNQIIVKFNATITINLQGSNIPGGKLSVDLNEEIGLVFDRNPHTNTQLSFAITSFPDLMIKTIATVVLDAFPQGNFVREPSGIINMTITQANFTAKVHITGATDSPVSLSFTTEGSGGEPLKPDGTVTWVATDKKFSGGSLEGDEVSVKIAGKMQPHP
jgi:hypothetical protein